MDGQELEVGEGTAIRVAPPGVRAWRNVSTEDLYYIVIQAKSGTMARGTITDGVASPGVVPWAQPEPSGGG